MQAIDRLMGVIQTLRGENCCPWDREQTVESLPEAVIEEAHELVEAIEAKNTEDLQEELGDLMFLSLFIATIAEQEGRLKVEDTVNGVADKLIRRHPHVFGDKPSGSVSDILVNWEVIKRAETKNKKRKTIFDGIPKGLPEVQRGLKILEKMKRSGHEAPEPTEAELREAFENFLKAGGEVPATGLMKLLLRYCHQKEIPLNRAIRAAGDMEIEEHLKKYPEGQ